MANAAECRTDDSLSKQVGIIIGSTRPNCVGKHIASWVYQLLRQQGVGSASVDTAYTLVDLAEWDLPLFDEPGIPARHSPVRDHTKAWQAKISSLSGFIFVTPQVHWSRQRASMQQCLCEELAVNHRCVCLCSTTGVTLLP